MPASARADVLRSFQFGGIVPGLALAGGIAVAATILRLATGSPVLSPMLVSVFAGIAIRLSLRPGSSFTPGLRFAARPVLRLGIILLGLQVTLSAIIGSSTGTSGSSSAAAICCSTAGISPYMRRPAVA